MIAAALLDLSNRVSRTRAVAGSGAAGRRVSAMRIIGLTRGVAQDTWGRREYLFTIRHLI